MRAGTHIHGQSHTPIRRDSDLDIDNIGTHSMRRMMLLPPIEVPQLRSRERVRLFLEVYGIELAEKAN